MNNRNIQTFAATVIVGILGMALITTGVARAEFLGKWDGEVRLGNLLPSFSGGVVFEECSGERWTIAGGGFVWTPKKCEITEGDGVPGFPPMPFKPPSGELNPPKPKRCPTCAVAVLWEQPEMSGHGLGIEYSCRVEGLGELLSKDMMPSYRYGVRSPEFYVEDPYPTFSDFLIMPYYSLDEEWNKGIEVLKMERFDMHDWYGGKKLRQFYVR